MKNSVRIVLAANKECFPDRATSDQYACHFEYRGKEIIIDGSGIYREINRNDIRKVLPTGEVTGLYDIMTIQFSKVKMFEGYEFEDNESDPTYSKDYDKNIKDIVEKFWGRNPICTNDGKAHANCKSEKHYDMINTNTKTLQKATTFKDKMRAARFLEDLATDNTSKLKDIAFYYNLHPEGKSQEGLLVELADLSTGHCLRAENLDEFLRIWVDGKSNERDNLVILKKAVGFEIITNKQSDGRNNFYLGESYLGGDENAMIDWSRKNEREFHEHVVKKVESFEKTESASIKSIAVNETTKGSPLEHDALRNEAKELKAEGFIGKDANLNMNPDKLKALVESGRKRKAEAKTPA